MYKRRRVTVCAFSNVPLVVDAALGRCTGSGHVQASAARTGVGEQIKRSCGRLARGPAGDSSAWEKRPVVDNCITYDGTYFTAAKSIIAIMRNLSLPPPPPQIFMGSLTLFFNNTVYQSLVTVVAQVECILVERRGDRSIIYLKLLLLLTVLWEI